MALIPIPERDSRVIERILRGARDDFEILVKRYRNAVYAIAYSRLGNASDAEDATQESFIKAFRNLGSIRDTRKFGAWIMTVTRNECTRIGRQAKMPRPPVDTHATESPDMASREFHEILRQQIHALEEPYRDVLLLHYFSGLKVREIAVLLEISKAAAGKRLERARAALGQRIMAELGAGLDKEGPSPKGEKRIMAAIVALPLPSNTSSTLTSGTTAIRYVAAAGVLGVVAIATFMYSSPQRQNDPQPAPQDAISLPTELPGVASVQVPTTLAGLSPQETASVDGNEPVVDTHVSDAVEVARGGKIEGHIFDAGTGKSLAGARFHYTWLLDSGTRYLSQASVGVDGRFTFVDLEPGTYTFEVNDYDQEQAKRTATITGGERVLLEFPLDLGGVFIAGKIVDEHGQSVSGARIEAMTNQENVVKIAESGEDGRYRVGGFLGPGAGFEASVTKDGFAFQHRRDFAVPEGGLSGVDFIMQPESTISGTLVDEQGNPLGDVGLRTITEDGSRPGLGTSGPRTDSNGAFTISHLSEGLYGIIATTPGGHSYSRGNEIARVEVARAEHIEGLVLVSPFGSGLAISGRVIDTLGKPVRGAMVLAQSRGLGRARSGPGYTRSDGSYVIEGLMEGSFRLSVSDDRSGRNLSIENVEAGSSGIDFVLDASATLRGSVVEASTGTPVPSFEMVFSIGLRDEIDHHALWQLKRYESALGEFDLKNLPPGDITLFVRADGLAYELFHVPALQPGEERGGVRVALSEGVSIEGRVLDPYGTPVSGAVLFLGPLPDQQFLTHSTAATTNELGVFSVQAPSGASQTLTAHDARYAPSTVEVSLLSDRIENLEITLGEGGALTGTVAFDAVLQPNAPLAVYRDETHLGNFQTDGDGAFHLGRLPAGPVTIRVYINGGGQLSVDGRVVVSDGEESVLALQGFSGDAAIEGTADWVGPQAVTWLILHAYVSAGAASEIHATESVRNGERYRFENLPEGPVRIEIQRIDGVTQESYYAIEETTLRAGETVQLDLIVTE